MVVQSQTYPLFDDQVAWSLDPNAVVSQATLNAAWTSLGRRTLTAAGFTQGRQYELGQAQPGIGTYALRNNDEALNPSNTSGTYYPNVLPYRRMRAVCAWTTGGGWSGNILNDTNASWGDQPVNANDASFELNTVGHWVAAGGTGGGQTLAASTTQAFSGTHSLRVTCATDTANGFGFGEGATVTFPAIPGQTMTVSGYFYNPSAGGVTNIFLALLGGASTATNTTKNAFTRLSVTFTASAVTHTVFLGTAASSTAGQLFYIDAVQAEFAAAATAFTTTGPTFYADYTGYAERWPETWLAKGFFGRSDVPWVDAFALLPRLTLSDLVSNELLQDSPAYYFPLTEAAGSATVYDLVAGATGTVLGRGAGSCVIGSQTSVTAETFPSVAIVGTDASTGPPSPYLQTNASLATSYTVEFALYVNPAANVLSETAVVLEQDNITGGTAILTGGWLSINLNNLIAPLPITVTATAVNSTAMTGTISTPGIHHIAVTNPGGVGTGRLYIDGVQVATQGTGVYASSAWGGVRLGTQNIIAGALPFNVGRVAIYNTELSAGRIASHAAGAMTAFAGELSGARYARIAGYLSSALPVAVDAGMSKMGPATGLAGVDVFTALTSVVIAEGGNQYISRDGHLTFSGRAARYSTAAATWVFGENVAGGEIPYTDGFTTDFDTQFVFNTATITRTGGGTFTSSDATSQGHYFPSSLTETVDVYSDNEARDIATWTVQQYKDPHVRLQQITFDPGKHPSAWPMCLSIQPGTRVTVKRRTPTGFVFSADFWVEQLIRDRSGGNTYTLGLLLSPVWTTNVWILGDSTYGVLSTTAILAR